MSQPATIKIVSRQTEIGGINRDSVEENVNGTVAARDGVVFVRWESDGVKNLLKLIPGTDPLSELISPSLVPSSGAGCSPTVELRRSGALNSRLTFITGKRTRGEYIMPEGALDIEVDTKELSVDNAVSPSLISMKYILFLNGEPVSENEISLHLS